MVLDHFWLAAFMYFAWVRNQSLTESDSKAPEIDHTERDRERAPTFRTALGTEKQGKDVGGKRLRRKITSNTLLARDLRQVLFSKHKFSKETYKNCAL